MNEVCVFSSWSKYFLCWEELEDETICISVEFRRLLPCSGEETTEDVTLFSLNQDSGRTRVAKNRVLKSIHRMPMELKGVKIVPLSINQGRCACQCKEIWVMLSSKDLATLVKLW
eukprot:798192_1